MLTTSCFKLKVLLADIQADTSPEPSPVKQLNVQTTQRSFLDTYAFAKMATENSDGTLVQSTSQPNQSYYLDDGVWVDLYDFNNTANFCIKALTTDVTPDINRDGIVDQEDVGQGRLARARTVEGADDRDPRDGVGSRHERRVNGGRHLRDDLEADEDGEDEHVEADQQR